MIIKVDLHFFFYICRCVCKSHRFYICIVFFSVIYNFDSFCTLLLICFFFIIWARQHVFRVKSAGLLTIILYNILRPNNTDESESSAILLPFSSFSSSSSLPRSLSSLRVSSMIFSQFSHCSSSSWTCLFIHCLSFLFAFSIFFPSVFYLRNLRVSSLTFRM